MRLGYKHMLVIACAVVFGVLVATIKGGSAGLRDSLGNISAPWLLLPYFAGASARGLLRGASMGLAACLAALAGFYIAEAFVLDLGAHPMSTNLELAVGAGRLYFAAGAITGPLFGALGGVCGRCRAVATAAVMGFVLIGEPLAIFTWLAHAGVASSNTGLITDYRPLWISEIVLGVVLSGGILIWRSSRIGTAATDPGNQTTSINRGSG